MASSKFKRRLARGEICGGVRLGKICTGKPLGPGLRCETCSGSPNTSVRPYLVQEPGMPKLSMTVNAQTPVTALWQLAGGLMDPQARALLLELSRLERAGTGLEDPIRLLEVQLLALYKRQGDANITQEEFDKQLLAIMEQIRKMSETRAKISLINAELARRDPNAFGPDALDPEQLTKG